MRIQGLKFSRLEFSGIQFGRLDLSGLEFGELGLEFSGIEFNILELRGPQFSGIESSSADLTSAESSSENSSSVTETKQIYFDRDPSSMLREPKTWILGSPGHQEEVWGLRGSPKLIVAGPGGGLHHCHRCFLANFSRSPY